MNPPHHDEQDPGAAAGRDDDDDNALFSPWFRSPQDIWLTVVNSETGKAESITVECHTQHITYHEVTLHVQPVNVDSFLQYTDRRVLRYIVKDLAPQVTSDNAEVRLKGVSITQAMGAMAYLYHADIFVVADEAQCSPDVPCGPKKQDMNVSGKTAYGLLHTKGPFAATFHFGPAAADEFPVQLVTSNSRDTQFDHLVNLYDGTKIKDLDSNTAPRHSQVHSKSTSAFARKTGDPTHMCIQLYIGKPESRTVQPLAWLIVRFWQKIKDEHSEDAAQIEFGDHDPASPETANPVAIIVTHAVYTQYRNLAERIINANIKAGSLVYIECTPSEVELHHSTHSMPRERHSSLTSIPQLNVKVKYELFTRTEIRKVTSGPSSS
jgi:hypothetical protein